MMIRLLGVLVTSVCLFAGPADVEAADLDGEREGRTGAYSPYDDPRYADVYRHPEGRPMQENGYYSDRQDRRDPDPRDPDPRDPRAYDGPPPAYAPDHAARGGYAYRPPSGERWEPCMSRQDVSRHARTQGWRVMRWHEVTRNAATFEAERIDDGRLFDVTVDRCSARLLAVSPVAERSYAQRPYVEGYGDNTWRRRVYSRPHY